MTTLDDTLEALGDAQRRRLLLALMEANPLDDSPAAVGSGAADLLEHDRALLHYHHVHLPKLEELGLIEWDAQRGEVVKGPAFEEARPLLELLDDHAEELPDGWP